MANSLHPSGISLCEKYVFLPFSSASSNYKRIFSLLHTSLSSQGLKQLENPRRLWQLTHLFIYRLVAFLKEFQKAWCPFASFIFSMYPLILFSWQFLSCSWLSFCNSPKHPIPNCSQMCSPLFFWYHDKWQLKFNFGAVQQFHTYNPSNFKSSKSI